MVVNAWPVLGLLFVLILALVTLRVAPAFAQEPIEPQAVLDGRDTLVYRMNIYESPPNHAEGVRLGIYQGQAAIGNAQAVEENLARLERIVGKASQFDVQLLSFPELYLSGYALTREMAEDLAQPQDGPAITKIQEIAKAHNMALIVPYPEVAWSDDGPHYFDAMAVIGADGTLLENYRKTHLYADSERLVWDFGWSDFPVVMVNGFPTGVLNCYEAEFPELSRILALKGAKLIVIPTAADHYYTLPDGNPSPVPYPDISRLLIPANAYQNNIFCAYANRRGYEKVGDDQWHFRGNSIISGPHGNVIIAAGHEQETLLIADLVPQYYGPTHPEVDHNYLIDRRPDLYGELVKEKVEFGGGFTYPGYPNWSK